MYFVDSHTHIFDASFDEDREAVIERAKSEGIERMLLPNIDISTWESLWHTYLQYKNVVDIAVGLHPTSVKENWREELNQLSDLLRSQEDTVKAIGEIGLDYYWDKTYYEEQKQVLEEQIAWALCYKKPVVLHTRDAHQEMLSIIRKYKQTPLKGVFHSFTGTEEELLELIEIENFYIGLNGVVTFKNSTLRDFIAHIPLDRLLLETDAPYLAPVPKRGKRNEPSFLIYTAREIANVYGISLELLAKRTTENYLRFIA